jgi:hypothetical protein
MSDLIDLDAVVSPDIKVKLAGQTWALPGDAQSDTLLRMIKLSQDMDAAFKEENTDRLLELRDELTAEVEGLFAEKNDLPEDGLHLSDAQIGELVTKLFDHYSADQGEGQEIRPTSTPAKPKSARRSPPRSAPRSNRGSRSSTSLSS